MSSNAASSIHIAVRLLKAFGNRSFKGFFMLAKAYNDTDIYPQKDALFHLHNEDEIAEFFRVIAE